MFRIQAAQPRDFRRLGLPACSWYFDGLAYQLYKTLDRISAVRFLRPEPSGLDAQEAVFPNSSARQSHESRANILRKGAAGEDIEPEAHGR